MTFLRKTRNTGWYIGGTIAALMMVLLAEYSTLPHHKIATSDASTMQKDYRLVLQNIQTIPKHLIEEKAGHQTLLAKRLFGVPEPANGPMAALFQMEGVHTPYLEYFDITAVDVPATWDADWLLEIIEQDPSVKYAYKEPKMKPFSVWPNDPAFGRQTNLHDPGGDVDIDAPEAWAYTTGSESVVIAVLDGNLDISFADLRPNLWVNTDEIPGNDIDDDNNGCIDDIHGCSFFSDASYRTGNLEGFSDHGTIVSSILARGNNNHAITGVIWNTRIMFVSGSFMKSLNYVRRMRGRGVNVRVISHSIGTEKACNPSAPRNADIEMRDGIRKAGEKGILFVQAIGNSNINYDISTQTQISPGCLKTDNMIVVAGQSKTSRTRWVYADDSVNVGSNYGTNVGDLYAPAEDLHYLTRDHDDGYLDIGLGTSLAAPHVAGAAALLWSFRPDLTVTEVRSALLDTVDRFDSFKLRDENGVPTTDTVASGGALNIANALYSVATPGIRIHSSQTTIAEGTSGYIDLSLTREPVRPSFGDVVVLEGVTTPRADATAIVTPSTLTFTSANWHIPQRMTVRAAGTSGSEITLQVSVDQHLSTTHYQSVPMRTATMTLQSDGIRPTLHMPARIAEGDITTATIRFSDPLINDATFTITATGTAVEGEHYSTLPRTITAAAHSTSVTFTIETIENAGYNGPDKTIHLQVTTDNPHIRPQALPLQATLTIEDRDTPIMTITVFPRNITQSNIEALAPTATATIQLDRMAVSDVRVFLHARPIGGGDINHLFYNISDDLNSNAWPASATIVENATATDIIIHSLDYDDDLGPSHWIRLSPSISDDAAARLGEPNRAILRTRDDDGDSSTYIRLRVFLEGAVETTPTDTIRASP